MEIRQQIISACQKLAKIKGFHNITVNELAACAGISKRTLYKRFSSKEEVLEAAIDLFIKDIALEADKILESEKEIKEILSKMLGYLMSRGGFLINHQVMEDLSKYYPDLWKKVDAFRMERIKLMIIKAYKQCDKKEINSTILISVIMASVQAVVNPDYIIKNELTFEEIIGQLTLIFLPSFIID